MPRLLLYDPLAMGHHLIYAENFVEWGLSRGFEVHFLGLHYEGGLFHRRFADHPRVRFHAFDPGRFAHRADFKALVRELGETGFYYDRLRTILFDDDGPAVQVAALKDMQARLEPDLTLVLYGDEMWDQWEAMVGRGEGFPRPTYLWLLYASGLRYDPCGLHSRDLPDFLARQRLFAAVATSDEYQAAALDTPDGVLRYVPDPYRRLGPPEDLADEERERLTGLRAFLEAGDGPVLLVPGLLEARKNASWLFDLVEECDDLSLVALGRRNLPLEEDRRAARLFARLADQGRFFGLADYVPDAFLETALQSPRVRILPLPYRRHDISSGIQLMALRAGLPCLVPDNGLTARRTLEHGLGEVFAHESAEDFSRAARALADYPREERAPACRAFAEHFTREAFFTGADRFFGLGAPAGPDPLVFDAARRNQALLQAEPHGPRASAWYLHKALSLREARRSEEALACLDKAASLAPEATRPTYLRAAHLEEAGRAGLGRPLLETLCRARPDHPDVKAWIDVQSDLVVKRLATSRARVEHLAGLARDLGREEAFVALLDVLSDRVWYHIHRGRHDLAQAVLLDVLTVAPRTAPAVSILALNRVVAGPGASGLLSWERLEHLLEEILAHNPENIACLRTRAELLVGSGRLEEAIAIFGHLAEDRGEPSAYLNQSDILRRALRFDEAEAALDKAVALGVCDQALRAQKAERIAAARLEAEARAGAAEGADILLPGTLAPGPGKKIAVVDLLFGWPPHGGAPRDIYEVFRHLAKTHHVRFILPAVKDGLMTRGRIEARLPFETQLVAMTPEEYTDATVGRKLRQAVDAFAPDAVYVGDGWAMKPAVVAALADYRPVVRFYAYEVACFRGAGERFRQGEPCPDSWLQTLDPAHHRRCIECCLDYFTQENPREAFFRRELVHAGAFEAGYPEFVSRTLGKASAIVCYNRAMADILSRHNPETHVVPSGVDLERFAPVDRAEVTPGQILFAGRVYDAKKGFSWALEACDLLAASGVEFSLLTTGVGKPVTRDYLENVGWINDDAKLAGLMARSAVCLVPSLWPEALGMTAIEAMSCGRPVVASRTGGLGELFTHGRQGLYVEPGDVRGLAAALRELLENPERGHAMGLAGRALAEERYGWESVVQGGVLPLLFPDRTRQAED